MQGLLGGWGCGGAGETAHLERNLVIGASVGDDCFDDHINCEAGTVLRVEVSEVRQVEQCVLVDTGEAHGVARSRYYNGAYDFCGAYQNGLRQGRWLHWDIDGHYVTDEQLHEGQRTGVSRRWTNDARRQLVRRDGYRGGKSHGPMERWDAETGQLVREGQYENGVAVGTWSQWAPDGTLLGSFELGDGSGLWTEWYDNGQVKAEGWYEDGSYVGFWNYYRPDGTRAETCEWFRDGRAECEEFPAPGEPTPTE